MKRAMSVRCSCVYKITFYQRTPRNDSFLRKKNSKEFLATHHKGNTLIKTERGGLIRLIKNELYMMLKVLGWSDTGYA